MEAFEQFVALAMESEGLVVSEALKFPVQIQTSKAAYAEFQTHGFEVDLVGARQDRLVLATVKSFFGSRGVTYEGVTGTGTNGSWYALLNRPEVRDTVTRLAAERFGYQLDQVEMRLYAGKFAGGGHEPRIREWCAAQNVGSGPIGVIGAAEVVKVVRAIAESKSYRDNAVLATLKLLNSVGALGDQVSSEH
jgi:hypothetical protein